MTENIIKKTCEELGINQRALGDIIHTSETSIYKWTSSNNPPKWAIKMFELLIKEKEFEELKEKLRSIN